MHWVVEFWECWKEKKPYRSSFELVWTTRFDRGRKGTRKTLEGKNPWAMVHYQVCFSRSFSLLGIFPKTCICLRKHTQDFEALSETKSVHKVMRRCNFSASGRIWYELEKSDSTRTTVLDSWFHWAGKVGFYEWTTNPELLQQFLEDQL